MVPRDEEVGCTQSQGILEDSWRLLELWILTRSSLGFFQPSEVVWSGEGRNGTRLLPSAPEPLAAAPGQTWEGLVDTDCRASPHCGACIILCQPEGSQITVEGYWSSPGMWVSEGPGSGSQGGLWAGLLSGKSLGERDSSGKVRVRACRWAFSSASPVLQEGLMCQL